MRRADQKWSAFFYAQMIMSWLDFLSNSSRDILAEDIWNLKEFFEGYFKLPVDKYATTTQKINLEEFFKGEPGDIRVVFC